MAGWTDSCMAGGEVARKEGRERRIVPDGWVIRWVGGWIIGEW